MKKRYLILLLVALFLFIPSVNATTYNYYVDCSAVDLDPDTVGFNQTGDTRCVPSESFIVGTHLYDSIDRLIPRELVVAYQSVLDQNFFNVYNKAYDGEWYQEFTNNNTAAIPYYDIDGSNLETVCITHVNGEKLPDAYCPSPHPDQMALFKSNSDGGSVSQRVFFAEGTPVIPPVAGSVRGLSFVCWTAENSDSCFNFTNQVMDGAVFNAKYEAIQYTISYNGNGATGIVPRSTVCDAPTNNQQGSFSEPCKFATNENLSKPGYEFAGWSFTKTNDNVNEDGYFQAGDSIFEYLGDETEVTLYAVWRPLTYKLTYKQNNNLSDVVVNYTYSSEGVVLQGFTPKKDGYVFRSWTPYNSNGVAVNDLNITVSSPGDKYVEAEYNARTVTFNYSGTNISSTTCSYTDTSCELSTDYTAPRGYEFSGWKIIDSNNTGVIIQAGETVDPKVFDKENINVEPVNEVITYEAIIRLNGGYGKNYEPKYNLVDSGNLTLGLPNNNPVKEGYRFTGWIYSDGTPVDVNNINRVPDLTISATYTENKITINYYNDGVLAHSQECTYSVDCYVSAPDIDDTDTKVFNGYRYKGNLYNNGDRIVISETSGIVGFVADYTYTDRVYYDVEYDFGMLGDDGYIDGNPLSQIESTATGVELPQAYAKGYHFDGWEKQKSDGTYVAANGSISGSDAIGTGNDKKVHLRAIWTPIQFTFNFNGSGYSGVTSVSCTYGEDCYLGTHTSENPGKVLRGWSFQPNGLLALGDNLYVGNYSDIEDEVIDLYPVWEVTQHHIYYYANGGTLSGNYTTVFDADTEADDIIFPTVTKDNARPTGWVDLDGYTITPNDIVNTNRDYVLIAKYQTTYNVSFELENGDAVGTPVTCTYGEECNIELPTVPVEEHYDGPYWEDENGIPLDNPLTITDTNIDNVTYIAKFVKVRYDVVFEDADGYIIPSLTRMCDYNTSCDISDVIAPENGTMVFKDWESDIAGTYSNGHLYLDDTTVDVVTLSPQYVESYQVGFYNTKTDTIETMRCGYGIECDLDSFLTQNFDGYADQHLEGFRDSKGKYAFGDTLLVEEDDPVSGAITFISDWDDEVFLIIKTYDNSNGYIFNYYDINDEVDQSDIPRPTRDNYRFTGYEDENGAGLIEGPIRMYSDRILTETWTNEYEVEFLYNYINYNGSITPDTVYQSVTCRYGEACDITVNNPTRNNNIVFDEWIAGDEGIDYSNPLTFSDTSYYKVSFRAQWRNN